MATKHGIHTTMIGRRVQINPASTFNPSGPQRRYLERAGQEAEVVNVYMKDDHIAYDLLFDDGAIETAMCAFGFRVFAKRD